MGQTSKNRLPPTKWVTLVKISHSWKKAPDVEQWIILVKKGHTYENDSHLENWVTL